MPRKLNQRKKIQAARRKAELAATRKPRPERRALLPLAAVDFTAMEAFIARFLR